MLTMLLDLLLRLAALEPADPQMYPLCAEVGCAEGIFCGDPDPSVPCGCSRMPGGPSITCYPVLQRCFVLECDSLECNSANATCVCTRAALKRPCTTTVGPSD